MRTKKRSAVFCIFSFCALVFFGAQGVAEVQAATCTWVYSKGSKSWTTAKNWNCDDVGGEKVPAATDTVVFDSSSTSDSTINSSFGGTVAGFQINSGYTGTITQNRSLTINGSFSQADGTFAGGSADIDINGAFTLSGGTFTSTSTNLFVGTDFTHSGGTFNHNNGMVNLDGANQSLFGSATFNNLTKIVTSAATLTFESSQTQTVAGALTLKGASGQLLSLRSSSTPTQWKLDPQGTRDLQFLDVKDSHNLNATVISTSGLSISNSGNNTNWNFPVSVEFTTASQSGDEGVGTVTVTAQLSAVSGSNVTVPFTVTGTAGDPADYTITASPITISAGLTTADITITVVNDTLDEDNETVIVTMGTPTNATKSTTDVHTATITDNDAEPTVQFSAASQSGAEDVGTLTVTAQLSAASGKNVTVPFTVSGTAGDPADYTITASPITITAGLTTTNITITVVDDTLDEDNETVIVTMGTPTNARKGATDVHTATINDNDAEPTINFSTSSHSGLENVGTMTITAQLSSASSKNVTVPFTVSGTAGNPLDYTITTSPITITAGLTTADITVTVVDDALDEDNETVIVTMGTPTNATKGVTDVHTATINDNDAEPTINFTTSSQSGLENAGTMTVTAELSATSSKNVTVPFTVSGTASDPGDYTITSSPITISAGLTTADITITVVNDTLDEDNETVIVTMGTPTNATKGATDVHTATVNDNDAEPAVNFTVASQSGLESAGTMTVTAELSAASSKNVTVPFTVSGTAGNPSDYTITTSPITISAGQTTTNITITVVDDELDEDNETVIVTMGTPTNAAKGATGIHTATINDNDSIPTVNFTTSSQSGLENAGTMTITAQLSETSSQNVTVPFTVSGTAGNPADYTMTTSPITITAGLTTATISITVVDDALDEVNETVIVTMGTPTNATKGATNVHTVTITDNDPKPTLTVADATVSEGVGSATITVTLTGKSGGAVTVNYTTWDGTASSGSDYATTTGTLTWNAGETGNKTFTVPINDDVNDEPPETVNIALSNAQNATLNDTSGLLTISDNDSEPTVQFTTASQSKAEDFGVIVLIAQLSMVSGKNVSIPFTVSGTASGSSDYTMTNSPVVIPAGDQTVNINITVVDDAVDESDETVIVTMGTPTNAVKGATSVHTATITDNDTAGITLTQSGGSTNVAEGGVGDTYTVVLNGQPTDDVVITMSAEDEILVSPTLLTFTPLNWDQVQTVTVTAVNDDFVEGNHTGTIDHSASSTDLAYDGISINSVTAQITDNDVAGVSVMESGGSTQVAEGEATDTYTIVLTSQPASDVDISVNADAQLSASPASLTFTADDWDQAQTITLSAADDSVIEGSHSGTVTHTALSSDLNYSDISISNLTATVTDNDSAGVTINKANGSTSVTEEGATDTYTMVLTSIPAANVVVSISSESQLSVDQSSITFTPSNWNQPQTITVSAIDDDIDEGNHAATITHSVSSADFNFDEVNVEKVTVQITDNDQAGVKVTESEGSTQLSEGGLADTYTIELLSQPTADVIITVSTDAELSVSLTSLTFTAENWDIPQSVTVTAVDDDEVEANQTGLISHSATSDDPAFNGIQIAGITVAINDNDVAPEQEGGSEEEGEGEEGGTEGSGEGDTIIAYAGPSDVISTVEGQKVKLRGNVILSNNSPFTTSDFQFTWRQTGGPAVTLDGANTDTAVFTAPDPGLRVAIDLSFELKVNVESISSVDGVTVRIYKRKQGAARLKEGKILEVVEGRAVARTDSGILFTSPGKVYMKNGFIVDACDETEVPKVLLFQKKMYIADTTCDENRGAVCLLDQMLGEESRLTVTDAKTCIYGNQEGDRLGKNMAIGNIKGNGKKQFMTTSGNNVLVFNNDFSGGPQTLIKGGVKTSLLNSKILVFDADGDGMKDMGMSGKGTMGVNAGLNLIPILVGPIEEATIDVSEEADMTIRDMGGGEMLVSGITIKQNNTPREALVVLASNSLRFVVMTDTQEDIVLNLSVKNKTIEASNSASDEWGSAIVAEDFTGDGFDDVAVLDLGAEVLEVYTGRNNSDYAGYVEEAPILLELDQEGIVEGDLLAEDYDGDGVTDLALAIILEDGTETTFIYYLGRNEEITDSGTDGGSSGGGGCTLIQPAPISTSYPWFFIFIVLFLGSSYNHYS